MSSTPATEEVVGGGVKDVDGMERSGTEVVLVKVTGSSSPVPVNALESGTVSRGGTSRS